MNNADTTPTAVHAQNGNDHLVSVQALRVLLMRDGSGWFAQGLDVDYSACGTSVEEVKTLFQEGFALTVREHLRAFQSIDRFLKPADQDAWEIFYGKTGHKCQAHRFSMIQVCSLDGVIDSERDGIDNFPFNELAFISCDAMAA